MGRPHLKSAFWDQLGISMSALCAVHCLFFPVALALLPLWPVTEAIHTWTHPVLFVLIAPTVVLAVRNKGWGGRVPLMLYAGLAIIGLAWLMHSVLGSWGESVVTLAGSALLVSGHWMNYKEHQQRCAL